MNGADAMAGSMLSLLNNKGSAVPKNVATILLLKSDILTMYEKIGGWLAIIIL
tara:strand:- start:1 stop:159 length:159 start_codon:yes stop_codon:yes gene_type:complete